jgi:hypothetical protein
MLGVQEQGLPGRSVGDDWRFLKASIQEWLGTAASTDPSRFWQTHFGALRDDCTAKLVIVGAAHEAVFAGSPPRAFISCALPNTLQVFDPGARQWVTNIVVQGDRPKVLGVSPDGLKVYAAIFESGNGTTLVGPKFKDLLFFGNAVSLTSGPYGGQNPPPNRLPQRRWRQVPSWPHPSSSCLSEYRLCP